VIRAVIQTESRFNPLAVSSVGRARLMQLMPTCAPRGIENPSTRARTSWAGREIPRTDVDRFKGNNGPGAGRLQRRPTPCVARHSGLPALYRGPRVRAHDSRARADTDAEFSLTVTSVAEGLAAHTRASPRRPSSAQRGTRPLLKARTGQPGREEGVGAAGHKNRPGGAVGGRDDGSVARSLLAMASASVRTTFTRALELSSASTTVQGAGCWWTCGPAILHRLLVLGQARPRLRSSPTVSLCDRNDRRSRVW